MPDWAFGAVFVGAFVTVPVLVALGLYIQSGRNAALKQRLYLPVYSAIAVVVILVHLTMAGTPEKVVFAIPVAVAAILLRRNDLRFCKRCGETVRMRLGPNTRHCPGCGAALDGA